MVGQLGGVQTFDSTKPCTLTITSTGTITLASAGQQFLIQPATFGITSFTRADSYVQVLLSMTSGVYPSIDIDMESKPASTGGDFFRDGGTMAVDARSFDPRTTPTTSRALSCALNVPAS